jgi:tyrosyl-tRNA synthetase
VPVRPSAFSRAKCVTLVHGAEAAEKAERAGAAMFSESIAELEEETLADVVRDVPATRVDRRTPSRPAGRSLTSSSRRAWPPHAARPVATSNKVVST